MNEIKMKGIEMVEEYERQVKKLMMKREEDRDVINELKRIMMEQGIQMRVMKETLRN